MKKKRKASPINFNKLVDVLVLKQGIICSTIFIFLQTDYKLGGLKVFCKKYFLISGIEFQFQLFFSILPLLFLGRELLFSCYFLFCFFSSFPPHDFSLITYQDQKLKCQNPAGRPCFMDHSGRHWDCPQKAFLGALGILDSRCRPKARRLTSHGPWAAWCFRWICQSSVLGSAQWCMVNTTGRVSSAPGGPQLTTGVSRVWLSSIGGLMVGRKGGCGKGGGRKGKKAR